MAIMRGDLLQTPAASWRGEIGRTGVPRGFLVLPRLSTSNSSHFLQKTFSMAATKSPRRYVGKKERISSSFARTEDTLMVAVVPAPGQLPLIQFVESDDLYLQDQPDVLWFDVLKARLPSISTNGRPLLRTPLAVQPAASPAAKRPPRKSASTQPGNANPSDPAVDL